MTKPITCVLLPLALTLSGCGWFGSDKPAQGGTAQGEILPGSTSDAMIAVDQVKSQAPLAPKSEGGEKPDNKDTAKARLKAAAPAAAREAEPEPVDEAATEE